MTSDGFVNFIPRLDTALRPACALHSMSDIVMAHCWSRSQDFAVPVKHGTWHTFRIEMNVDTNTITFYIDGKQIAEDHYERSIKGSEIYIVISVDAAKNRTNETRPMVGYVDNVRIYPLEYINP